MIEKRKSKILTFVGLAGSGKTTAADYVAAKGCPKVYFGGVMLDFMKNAGVDISPENEQQFRTDLIAEKGIDYVSKKIAQQISSLLDAGQYKIVADGLSSWTEYKMLKREFPNKIILVAVIASKKLRHRRLTNRPVRPLSKFEADQRDWTEIEQLEKGGPIAIADHYIINNGNIDDLHEKIDQLLIDIEFLS